MKDTSITICRSWRLSKGTLTMTEMQRVMHAVSYYDATWALTLALNASINYLPPGLLSDYKHGQPQTTKVIRQYLSRLQFEGSMGRIVFFPKFHQRPK